MGRSTKTGGSKGERSIRPMKTQSVSDQVVRRSQIAAAGALVAFGKFFAKSIGPHAGWNAPRSEKTDADGGKRCTVNRIAKTQTAILGATSCSAMGHDARDVSLYSRCYEAADEEKMDLLFSTFAGSF